jgi:hypothetical protein
MRCRDCPYGIESFEKYKPYIDEEDAENCIWCDKVGGKIYAFGHCSDWYEQDIECHKNRTRKKRKNKYERNLKYKNHLKDLHETVGGYYPTPVRYTDKIWIKGVGYAENPKPYYQRLYRGKRSKYLKQQSNRKIRRYKGELHNGYQHIHKIYDFWWEYS